ncbi:MAG: tetratricopeptide repeat protein [Holophagaceae bacterium]|nr:tetratricopeptide repeat protein [Holophagaceae bacterium]
MLSVLAGVFIQFAGLSHATASAPIPILQEATTNDPFWVPQEMFVFARRRASLGNSERGRAEELLKALVHPPELGGMGIAYSNDRTRTISEVWAERKANCLSLTMTYVMLAKQLRIRAIFAESFDVYNWSRAAGLILREKHMVAIVLRDNQEDLVADFLPRTRPRFGSYLVDALADIHAKSLYYSNSAVEALLMGDRDWAKEMVLTALDTDPASSQAWNILGVIEKAENNVSRAIIAYRTAIANNPKNVAAISNLAALCREEGFFAEYARLRAMENRLRKWDPYYHAFLASEFLDNNDLKKALKSIQSAIKLHPKDSDFYVILSHVLHAQGKIAEALDSLVKAREYTTEDRMDALDQLIEELRGGDTFR